MTDNQIRNEEQIIRLVQSGDTTAMRSLYNLHIRYLTAVCARYLARDEDVKDALQEAFLKIFSSIGRFEYRGEGSLRAWMTRIVINEALKLLRREQRIDTVDLRREHNDTADEEPATEEIPAEALHEMIRTLPAGYRTVFNLYVMEQKSHKEIAALLGISESTSASQLHRAKGAAGREDKNITEPQTPHHDERGAAYTPSGRLAAGYTRPSGRLRDRSPRWPLGTDKPSPRDFGRHGQRCRHDA